MIDWDVQKGPFLNYALPNDLDITTGLLTQIYSAHRYYSLEAGISSITFHNYRIVSFFSGLEGEIIEDPNHVLAMLLRKDEKIGAFKKILLQDMKAIFSAIPSGKYKDLMEDTFEKMKKTS